MSSLYYIVLFCLLAIGWELFMWSFCGVLVELLLSLSAFLGRNYRLHKKEEKKAPIAAFLKMRQQTNPMQGTLVVFQKMQLKAGLQPRFLKTQIQVSAYSRVFKTWLQVQSLSLSYKCSSKLVCSRVFQKHSYRSGSIVAVKKCSYRPTWAYCCAIQARFVNATISYSRVFLGSIAAFLKCGYRPLFLQCIFLVLTT